MAVKMWNKRETQSVIKQLRDAGYLVKKANGTYKIIDETTDNPWMIEGKPLFRAMVGTRGYLVNFHDSLLTPIET